MVGLCLGEEHFIQGGIAQDLGSDGRKRLTYRPIYVETGVIPQANGSARVRLGKTDVISSVKAELGKPSSLQPDKGKGKGGEELSTELSVALQHCLLGAKSLKVELASLSNTGIPRVHVAAGALGDEQPEVDISEEEFLQFDTSNIPVIVTLTKVGRHYIVDAISEEEFQMSSTVSISVNRKGHICGLTKRGGAGLDPSIILGMMPVVEHVSEQLINKLDSEIAAAEAGEEES
uniref:Ribosomal RNA-processing protein 42 n=1 Tax=Quercus lobata TaxID=97700 RepID=A0A7N2R0F9_QUELO